MSLEILKSYKLYIGGYFVRTESGRYYEIKNNKGKHIANVCLASRKDLRNAVMEARKSFSVWSSKTAFNRSQIIYRMAEMLDNRKEQFIKEMILQGFSRKSALEEFNASVDCIVYYAGWCDKYQQIFSSVNPVNDSYFNFSVLEPMGVVMVVCPEESPLLGFVSTLIPVIVGANTAVVLASNKYPLSAISFAEVIACSDIPFGTVNIITGENDELMPHYAGHKDINAVYFCKNSKKDIKYIQENSISNLKRVIINNEKIKKNSPYKIYDFQEVKTTWHPIENTGIEGSGY